MAARKVATISINLQAGTAQFISDMDAAKAKIGQFGQSSKQSMVASSAALRELEGNFANNNRAIARFLATSLGLGPALQAVFPLVGGLAFGTMLVELGGKVVDFFKSISQAPEKIKGAFRELTAPIKLSNDELQVANDRLSNEIAKLEGRRQNNLKLALDEARVAADKLAESLDKDLSHLNKLLAEQNVGMMRRFFGEAGTSDIKEEFGGKTGFGGLAGDITEINRVGQARIDAATNLKEADRARGELNIALSARYAKELEVINQKLHAAQELAKTRIVTTGGQYGDPHQVSIAGSNETARIEELKGAQRALMEQMRAVALQATNTGLTERKEALETARANELLDRPFADRMKALQATLEASRLKLSAVGQSEAFQVQAKASGEALKVIEEVNKALEKQQSRLTITEKDAIKAVILKTAQTDAEASWKTKLDETTKKISDQVQGQEMLTAAIGQGYEATKKANVEIQLMQAVGAERYNDQANAAALAIVRLKLAGEYDAKNAEQSARRADALSDQIELERILAKVQMEGAEAVRYATLQFEIQKKIHDGASVAEIKAIRDEYAARRANESSAGVSKINERIAAVQRLIAAQADGAEAARKAQLESKYAEMRRKGGAEIPGMFGMTTEELAERTHDELEHEQQVAAKALERGQVYKNQLETIRQESAELDKIKVTEENAFEIEKSRRSLDQERLQILVQQTLEGRKAIDGVRAFFLEMQKQAKSAADIIYDTMTSALDQVSDQFAKLITLQKTSFAKMFQSLGESMLKESFKSLAQTGLGKLGKVIGGPLGGVLGKVAGVGKADGSSGNPYHTKVADGNPDGSMMNPFYVIAMSNGTGAQGGSGSGVGGGLLSALFGAAIAGAGGSGGGGSSGGGESVTSSISFPGRAGGGSVSPDQAYIVGENGPEILAGASGRILSNSESMKSSSAPLFTIGHIDARGGDPVLTRQNVHAAITAAHESAIANSVRVNSDRMRRTPPRH